MIKKMKLVLILVIVTHSAFAQIALKPTISVVNDEYSNWTQDLISNTNLSNYTECREVLEIPNAYLCLSDQQREMNDMFARASIFVEGLFGIQKGSVVAMDDSRYLRNKDYIGGHDLKVSDLQLFFEKVKAECLVNQKMCLGQKEFHLMTLVEDLVRSNTEEEIVIISGSYDSSSFRGVVKHEIYHAIYFLNASFRLAVDEFWNTQMSESQRNSIRSVLGTFYDKTDEFLMRNEFQAYILGDEDVSMLGGYGPLYKGKLNEWLLSADIELPQFNL